MKKYLVALVIGIGLMANGPAFAEELVFDGRAAGDNTFREEPMEECLRSAEKDYLLSSHQIEKDNTVVDFKTYLRKTASGGSLDNWRVYRVLTLEDKDDFTIKVYCYSLAKVMSVNIPEG